MKPLAIFGLVADTAMLVSYAMEKRSHWMILAFAVSCALGSLYGFLQGACRLESWKLSGRLLQFSAGEQPLTRRANPSFILDLN